MTGALCAVVRYVCVQLSRGIAPDDVYEFKTEPESYVPRACVQMGCSDFKQTHRVEPLVIIHANANLKANVKVIERRRAYCSVTSFAKLLQVVSATDVTKINCIYVIQCKSTSEPTRDNFMQFTHTFGASCC